MITRQEIKRTAKIRIFEAGSKLLLFALFVFVACNAADYVINLRTASTVTLPAEISSAEEMADYLYSLVPYFKLPIISLIILLIYNVFAAVLRVGFSGTCLKASRRQSIAFSDLFVAFSFFFKTFFLNVIKGVLIYIGYALFVVPGIILSMCYAMTDFVLLDDPTKSVFEILSESRRLMKGLKWRFFVQRISYFGWYLLEYVTSGIASVWVTPYVLTGDAIFYDRVCRNVEEPLSEETIL